MRWRLTLISLWLLLGHAAWLAIFWGLLQVPESSVWTLALSSLLVVTLVVLAAGLHAGASAAWRPGISVGEALAGGSRRLHATVLAAAVFGLLWWATAAVLAWHGNVAGQIDALYIARTGRSNTGWIHGAMFWIVMFARWTIGLTLAVSLLAALVGADGRQRGAAGWLRAALVPRRWLTLTFWLVLLIAVPWQFVSWRPARLSLGLEPWFVAAKLGLIAVSMSAGWALVLRAGHDYRTSDHATPSASDRATQAAANP